MNRYLRDLLAIARKFGLDYMGLDGVDHHTFGADGKIAVRAPGTPRDDGVALTRFEHRCEKLDRPSAPSIKPEQVDGNAAFRKFGAGRSDP